MKKQFDSCLFDYDLKKLDADFVWTDANNPELKGKLMRDMNKRQLKSKFTKPLGYVGRFSAIATVILIVFIFGNQGITINGYSGSGSPADTRSEYPVDRAPIMGDRTVTFSADEQNLIEGVKGNPFIPLTNEATIARDFSKEVSFISGKPEIEATKMNDKILVKATYPVTNGQPIIVRATENTYGSKREARDALKFMYLKSEKVSISNREAIFYNFGGGEGSELLIIEDKYLYFIKGEENKSALIKVAEQINFSN